MVAGPGAAGLPSGEVAFSSEERERYGRHLVLPGVGEEGQARLREARVAIVGLGGLGSPVALYLAAAGVGRLGLFDGDIVSLSNLQRQVIHSTDRLGMPKVESARLALQALNPHVEIQAVPASLTRANVVESLAPFDVIVGCTDNFPARYLLNDACVLLRKPWVDGAIRHFDGQVAVYLPGRGPCYRCLFPEPPPPELLPSGADLGVMGVVPGIIGCLQASEVLKLLLGRGEPLAGRLLLFDGLRARFREIRVPREPNCPACGEGETP